MRELIIAANELFPVVPSCWIDSMLAGSCYELSRSPPGCCILCFFIKLPRACELDICLVAFCGICEPSTKWETVLAFFWLASSIWVCGAWAA